MCTREKVCSQGCISPAEEEPRAARIRGAFAPHTRRIRGASAPLRGNSERHRTRLRTPSSKVKVAASCNFSGKKLHN